MILIASVLKKDKKYYLQVPLEECKYFIKEEKKGRYVKDELEVRMILMENRSKLNITIVSC